MSLVSVSFSSNISKDSWKLKVTHNVSQSAFDQLTAQIKDKTKTGHLSYTTLCFQPYMRQLSHKQASIVFKLRSCSIDCKANRKSSNINLSCRLCEEEDETQLHIINCPSFCSGKTVLDLSKIFNGDISDGDEDVLEVCERVNEFNSLVNDSKENNSALVE